MVVREEAVNRIEGCKQDGTFIGFNNKTDKHRSLMNEMRL